MIVRRPQRAQSDRTSSSSSSSKFRPPSSLRVHPPARMGNNIMFVKYFATQWQSCAQNVVKSAEGLHATEAAGL